MPSTAPVLAEGMRGAIPTGALARALLQRGVPQGGAPMVPHPSARTVLRDSAGPYATPSAECSLPPAAASARSIALDRKEKEVARG
jgi:hypothetical protein